MESAFNPEPENIAARNEAPLGRQEKIERLMKGAELLVEKDSPLVIKVKELTEEYGTTALVPIEVCADAVETYGYEPEMVYAVGKVLESTQ